MSLDFDQRVLHDAIKMPMAYLVKELELGDKVVCELDERLHKEIDDKLQALIEFHIQIIEHVHVIGRLLGDGLPSQAAILTATVYELSHKGFYIFNNPDALEIWLSLPVFKQEFEKQLNKSRKLKTRISIRDIVEDNIKKSGHGSFELEYGVYKQLCRFKHPHPIFNRLWTDGKNILMRGGNRSDDQAIQHSWFMACEATKYAGYIVEKMLSNYPTLFSNDLIIMHDEITRQRKTIDTYVSDHYPDWKCNPLK